MHRVVVIFGFGSALSIYHQAALAATLMWCASAAVVAVTGGSRMRSTATVVVVLASLAMLTSNVVDSRHHPFDSVDVGGADHPIRFGAHHDELPWTLRRPTSCSGSNAPPTTPGCASTPR